MAFETKRHRSFINRERVYAKQHATQVFIATAAAYLLLTAGSAAAQSAYETAVQRYENYLRHDGRSGTPEAQSLRNDIAIAEREEVLSIGMLRPDPMLASPVVVNFPEVRPEGGFNLGAEPNYEVDLGGVRFVYRGARVGLSDSNVTITSIHAGPGWATDDHYGLMAVGFDASLWLKGYVTVQAIQLDAGPVFRDGFGNPVCVCSARFAYRAHYHPVGGGRPMMFYELGGEKGYNAGHTCTVANPDTPPTQFWSDSGTARLDLTSLDTPVIYWGDGTVEELPPIRPEYIGGNCGPEQPGGPGIDPMGIAAYSVLPQNLPASLRRTDRNGNVTRFSDTRTQQVQIDPRGRRIELAFDITATLFRRLRTVTVQGAGGASLVYTVDWETRHVVWSSVFPELCHPGTCTWSSDVDVVTAIHLPDGRAYTFGYGPYANLTSATEPDGSLRTWIYGDASNSAHVASAEAAGLLLFPDRIIDGWHVWSGLVTLAQVRTVVREELRPNGAGSSPVETTDIWFETTDLGESCNRNTPNHCCTQVWRNERHADGTRERKGFCTRGPQNPDNGLTIGTETYSSSGALMSATYTGDKNAGVLYYDFTRAVYQFSSIVTGGSSPPRLDNRPMRIVNLRDGLATTTTYHYDDTLDFGQGGIRNTLNVTRQCVFAGTTAVSCDDGQGADKLVEQSTTFVHPGGYFGTAATSRNLLQLAGTTIIKSGTGQVVLRKQVAYDQYGVLPSGAPNLDGSMGNVRGNATSATAYTDPAGATGTTTSTTTYDDTGNPRVITDARGVSATTTYDNALCSDSHRTVTTSVKNALDHVTSTVTDCYTGAILRVTDPNNQRTCTQYDRFGRAVATAGPGDSPLVDSTLVGATCTGGAGGPMTQIERPPLGTALRWVVQHTKDGTTDGHQRRTFLDGLGRTIQTCTEVDPAIHDHGWVCDRTTYDAMGRVSQAFVPFYADSVATTPIAAPSGTQFIRTAYDSLGRVTSSELVGPQGQTFHRMETSYGTASYTALDASTATTGFLTTAKDANNHESKSVSNVLGHVVETRRQWGGCPDGFCVTKLKPDVLGRVTKIQDAAQNLTTLVFDGLGRKVEMTDPDMGHWAYVYDANGNLTKQTDAKAQDTTMQYDPLNRLTLEDVSPPGPGSEDVVNTYDGVAPSTCYSCNDWCPTTIDSCNATQTCTHVGQPCDLSDWTFLALHAESNAYPNAGYAYYIYPFNVRYGGDTSWNGSYSKLRLFENGVELGPAHTAHATIQASGGGRFSHWYSSLYFSSSDNSDPRTNGRFYSIAIPSSAVSFYGRIDPSTVQAVQGNAYALTQAWGTLGDSVSAGTISRLRLYEDGVLLGPPHTAHATIASTGQGRYSHWYSTLYFSASDNSDPRANTRNYTWAIEGANPPACGVLDVQNAVQSSGHLYNLTRNFGVRQDSPSAGSASPVRLFENGVELRSAHSLHADIIAYGGGRFSDWNGPWLYFSTSDNTDPRTNGRTYTWYSETFCPCGILDAQNALPSSGYLYNLTRNFRLPQDTSSNGSASPVRLFENGLELTPAHSLHADIIASGGGRFSDWNGPWLYFSTSDHTDPRTNGRTYSWSSQTGCP